METQKTEDKESVANEVFMLIRRIIKTCVDESKEGVKTPNCDERVRMYTGHETVPDVTNIKKRKDQQQQLHVQENCEAIRRLLVTKYLKEYKILTMDDVKKEFNNYLDIENNGALALENFIRNAGFVLKNLPNTDKEIVMEHPLQLFRRQKYLKNIMKYREQGKNIIYITELDFNAPDLIIDYNKFILIAMSTDFGVLNISHCDNDTINKKHIFLKELLKEKVFPIIYSNSVLILEEEDLRQNKDTDNVSINSTRKEIIDFLEKNDIPYDARMHKGILLNLASKVQIPYNNNDDIVDFIKSFEYDALRRPCGFQSLDVFQPLKETIQKIYTSINSNTVPLYSTFSTLVKKMTLPDWKNHEDKLREIEINIYEDDAKVDILIDKILTMSKYSRVPISLERCVFDKK